MSLQNGMATSLRTQPHPPEAAPRGARPTLRRPMEGSGHLRPGGSPSPLGRAAEPCPQPRAPLVPSRDPRKQEASPVGHTTLIFNQSDAYGHSECAEVRCLGPKPQ